MIKLLFIGGLVYVLYRLFTPDPLPPSKQDILDAKAEEDEFVDYEDVD